MVGSGVTLQGIVRFEDTTAPHMGSRRAYLEHKALPVAIVLAKWLPLLAAIAPKHLQFSFAPQPMFAEAKRPQSLVEEGLDSKGRGPKGTR